MNEHEKYLERNAGEAMEKLGSLKGSTGKEKTNFNILYL